MLDGAGAESNPRRREALFTVLIDHGTFLSGTLHPDSVLETVDGGVIPIGIAERWLCDSRWQLLVGEINADQMALLCRHHHRMVHAGSLEIMMVTAFRCSSTGTATS